MSRYCQQEGDRDQSHAAPGTALGWRTLLGSSHVQRAGANICVHVCSEPESCFETRMGLSLLESDALSCLGLYDFQCRQQNLIFAFRHTLSRA